MSQFVEHEASNLRVAGSSPALGMDRHGYLAHGQRWHHDIIWELVVPILTAGCVWGEGGCNAPPWSGECAWMYSSRQWVRLCE